MIIIDKNGNVEREYSVDYDKERLEKLLDEIIKNVSYRIDGHFEESSDKFIISKGQIKESPTLPNGDVVYENIENIVRKSETYLFDIVSFNATKVMSPQLAYILQKILKEDPTCIKELFDYSKHKELNITIGDTIAEIYIAMINTPTNEIEVKIKLLEDLKKWWEREKKGQYFNIEKLRQYYSDVRKAISSVLFNPTFFIIWCQYKLIVLLPTFD